MPKKKALESFKSELSSLEKQKSEILKKIKIKRNEIANYRKDSVTESLRKLNATQVEKILALVTDKDSSKLDKLLELATKQ